MNVRENLNLLYLLHFHVPFSLVWNSLCVAEDLSRPLNAVEKDYVTSFVREEYLLLVLCYMHKKITVIHIVF